MTALNPIQEMKTILLVVLATTYWLRNSKLLKSSPVNRKKRISIFIYSATVSTAMHIKFASFFMVIEVVSNQDNIFPYHFFPQYLRVSVTIYIRVLDTVDKLCIHIMVLCVPGKLHFILYVINIFIVIYLLVWQIISMKFCIWRLN